MKTCHVTGYIRDPNGQAPASGTIKFSMVRVDKDQSTLVLSGPVVVNINCDGSVNADLWPNVRGFAGTYYSAIITVTDMDDMRRYTFEIPKLVVPDAATALLNDISELSPPPPVDEGRQQVILAREARDEARSYRDTAGEHAEQTGKDSEATSSDRIATGRDREATNADASATAEDRLQTGRDAQATADDRRQTGEDRSAVADDKRVTTENREATAADARATKADAEATAADKRQTGEDRTATGQDRTAAAAAAASAVAATLVRYGCTIFKADGIDAGGYYVEQRVFKPSKQTVIYAEILNGDPGAEAVVTLQVNGVAVNVPIVVKPGAPITLTGLNVNLIAADKVRFIVAPTPGKVRELFLATYGAVA